MSTCLQRIINFFKSLFQKIKECLRIPENRNRIEPVRPSNTPNYALRYDTNSKKCKKVTELNMSGYMMPGCVESIAKINKDHPDDWMIFIGYTYKNTDDCQVGLSGTVKDNELFSRKRSTLREAQEETGIKINPENLVCMSDMTYDSSNGRRVTNYTCRLDDIDDTTAPCYLNREYDNKDVKSQKIQLCLHGEYHNICNRVKRGLNNLAKYNPDAITHIMVIPINHANIIAHDIWEKKTESNLPGWKFSIKFRKIYDIGESAYDAL